MASHMAVQKQLIPRERPRISPRYNTAICSPDDKDSAGVVTRAGVVAVVVGAVVVVVGAIVVAVVVGAVVVVVGAIVVAVVLTKSSPQMT